VDATRLERNLNLALQILEITDRVVLCLNLMDEAERHEIKIDERMLSKDLGIPVIPAVARYNKGMNELLNSIYEVATGKYVCKPYRIKSSSRELNYAVEKLSKMLLEEFPNLPNVKWVALRLLEGDQSVIDSIRNGELGRIYSTDQKKSELEQVV
jgi:Fe2+ transport system protein B